MGGPESPPGTGIRKRGLGTAGSAFSSSWTRLDAAPAVRYAPAMVRFAACALLSLLVGAACSSGGAPAAQGGASSAGTGAGNAGGSDAGGGDAGPDDAADAAEDVDKAVTCAATFGSALTNAFGRLDGTVLAVVPPGDEACAMPNSTHAVIQVTMQGATYRMVLDVLSSVGNPDVFFYETNAPLAAGPWAEGWHAGVALDYVTTLSLHDTSFVEMVEADLVAKVTSEIALGAHVSVFATSDGEPSSAHLIHRNLTNADGAIVLEPESASPHYLLFRFGDQSF
jgi:hypothetical protein